MPAITFPPNPTRLDYTVTPWVDPYGSPWIWNQTKLRWRADVVLSDKQPLDADLTAIAALTTTAHGRSLLTSADATASRAAIGAGTSNVPAYLAITAVPISGATPTPSITSIGQGAIVSHTGGTYTEWGAVSLTQWLPRTAGILKHASGPWYRASLAADGTAQYDLLLNQ